MKQKVYSVEDVMAALNAVVKDVGEDYRYPQKESVHYDPTYDYPDLSWVTCSYVSKEGNPSCIVGRVIYKLDPKAFSAIARHERVMGSFSAMDLPRDVIRFDLNALVILSRAQNEQDEGECFGKVLDKIYRLYDYV